MSRRLHSSPLPVGAHSRSTPNLPTLHAFKKSNTANTIATTATKVQDKDAQVAIGGDASEASSTLTQTSPSEPASIEDFSLDDPSRKSDEIDEIDKHEQEAIIHASGPSPEASDSDESDLDTLNNLPSSASLDGSTYRPPFSRSSSYLGPATFAPPFYNRPPTPLPPSPSLTSLLRPNFTSASSRPATPDPSSDEGSGPATALSTNATTTSNTTLPTGAQTPNSAAATTLSSSFRTARPIPRASPKVPTYEYYGFTLYLTSSLGFLIYLLWSYLPSPFLHQLGIYYYPNRWWSLAIPAWLVTAVVWVFVALASYNTGTLTLKMADLGCLVDEAAVVAVVDGDGNIVREGRTWDAAAAIATSAAAAAAAATSSASSSHATASASATALHSSASSSAAASSSLAALGTSQGVQGKSAKNNDSRKGMLPRTKSSMAPDHHHNHRQRSSRTSQAKDLDWRSLWNEGTDAVLDVPIGGVCEVLYGRLDQKGDDEGEEGLSIDNVRE
ncbi:hypothetical protein AAFC00_000036 [Neodothiora populina]|uniref:PIG-P domain-containing protein n=1 Tax=Neodothiora populina TaxID=2781224 RepID=A0ABR3P1E0_9PEZI